MTEYDPNDPVFQPTATVTPAVDQPQNNLPYVPGPRSRPDLNNRVYQLLQQGHQWAGLQLLYAFADSGLPDNEVRHQLEGLRNKTVEGVQATALKQTAHIPRRQRQLNRDKDLASEGNPDMWGGAARPGVIATQKGVLASQGALDTVKDFISQADDGFKHLWDDPVLQKKPSLGLALQIYLSNTLGPVPIKADTLEHTQRQIQLMGYGRDLEVTGAMTPGWRGAIAEWKQGLFRSQLAGNRPGAISVSHALEALEAITPTHAWGALVGFITHLPDGARQLMADFAGSVAGLGAAGYAGITGDESAHTETHGDVAAWVNNTLGGDHQTGEENVKDFKENFGQHLLEDGVNAIMIGSMLGSGSRFFQAAGTEMRASTVSIGPLTEAEAARAGGIVVNSIQPGAIAKALSGAPGMGNPALARGIAGGVIGGGTATLTGQDPGTILGATVGGAAFGALTAANSIPVLSRISPVIDKTLDADSWYYSLRNFVHTPYTMNNPLGSATRLADTAFNQSLLLGGEAQLLAQGQQTLTGDTPGAAPFGDAVLHGADNSPIDHINDAISNKLQWTGIGDQLGNVDNLMFVFSGGGARALHTANSQEVGQQARTIMGNFSHALSETGNEAIIQQLYGSKKSMRRIIREFGGGDNFTEFWLGPGSPLLDQAANWRATVDWNKKNLESGGAATLSSRDRIIEIQAAERKIRSDPEQVHKALDELMTQGGGDELRVRVAADMANRPWRYDPVGAVSELEAYRYARESLLPLHETARTEAGLPTTLGKKPKIANPEAPMRGLRKGYVRVFRGERAGAIPTAPEIEAGAGRWWSADYQTATQYGEHVAYIDITPKQFEKFRSGSALDRGDGSGTNLIFEDVSKAQKAPRTVDSTFLDIDELLAPTSERYIPPAFQNATDINEVGLIPKGAHTQQSAYELEAELRARLESLEARRQYNPDQYQYAQRQTSVGEEHLNPDTPSPGPRPTPEEYIQWDTDMANYLERTYHINMHMQPQRRTDRLNVAGELRQKLLPEAIIPHNDAPAYVQRVFDKLDEMGYVPVNAKDISHRISDSGAWDELRGATSFRRRLAERVGISPDHIQDRHIGMDVTTHQMLEIKKVQDEGYFIGVGHTPQSILDTLRRDGALPDVSKTLKGRAETAIGAKAKLAEKLEAEDPMHMMSRLPLREQPRRVLRDALMDPAVMYPEGNPMHDAFNAAIQAENDQRARDGLSLITHPDAMPEASAERIVHAIYHGAAKVDIRMTGLHHIEDMFRGLGGFFGKTLDNKLGWSMANLPNRLIQLRNTFRFDLNPMFDIRRMFKTNIKMMPFGIPPVTRPIHELMDDAMWAHAQEVLHTAKPDRFSRETLGFIDEADRYIRSQGMFGWNPAGYEAWVAHHLDAAGMHPEEISKTMDKIFTYGDRTQMERSMNFLFFPFSFEKSLYKIMGSYILDHPAQRLLLTHGMAAYDDFNKNHMDGSNPLATSFWHDHLPIFERANHLNAFTAGISLGEPGGINRPLLNVFLPQAFAPNKEGIDMLHRFIPAVRDFEVIWENAYDQGRIINNVRKNVFSSTPVDISHPVAPTTNRYAQLDDAFKYQLHLQSVYHDAIQANVKIPTEEVWGEWAGKPMTMQVIREIVAKKYPVYRAEGAAAYVQHLNATFDKYLQTLRGTPKDGRFVDVPRMPSGIPKYQYIRQFQNATDSLATALDTATNPSILAKRTERLRSVATYLAEQDPKFYSLYQSTFQRILGPLERVKQ